MHIYCVLRNPPQTQTKKFLPLDPVPIRLTIAITPLDYSTESLHMTSIPMDPIPIHAIEPIDPLPIDARTADPIDLMPIDPLRVDSIAIDDD